MDIKILRKVISLVIYSVLALEGSSCSESNDTKSENINEDSAYYETAEFSYLPDIRAERQKLCDVHYYVKEDTLFSSEKYHALYLGYSNQSDSTLNYVYSIFFDTEQKPNEGGWYFITLKDAEIPRIPFTYLSSIRLMNYFGPLVNGNQEFEGGWPDAVLYNFSRELVQGRDKNKLTQELTKLLPYIR